MFNDLFSHVRTIYHKVKLAENPLNLIATNKRQVSGYLPPAVYDVPPAVYDQLTAFKAKRGLQSVEMAVTVILSEYFGLSQTPAFSVTDTTSRLEALEAKCTNLSETVAELRAALITLQCSNNDACAITDVTGSAVKSSESQITTDDSILLEDQNETLTQPFNTPLTQAALAKRLGVNTSTISRMQSKLNFSEWSQQKDPEGIPWVRSPDTKLFHPQSNYISSI